MQNSIVTNSQIAGNKQMISPQIRFSVANTEFPKGNRKFSLFNQNKVEFLVSQKEQALPELRETLKTSRDEKEITEALYTLNKLADIGTKGIPAMYPILARFNNTKSPNIQAFLVGVYRKTQVPDAFGPLVSMLVKNSVNKNESAVNFDPNEEIGGAILAYIENYSNNPPKIDYSA